jgi:hypothetical protein
MDSEYVGDEGIDTGYRRLAAAIIAQAVNDYFYPKGRKVDKDLNRNAGWIFLTSNDDLNFWCEVAGMDATAIREKIINGSASEAYKAAKINISIGYKPTAR